MPPAGPGEGGALEARDAHFELQTRDEAAALADRLGALFPDPVRATLGLQELMFNAIEHGNLEIGRALKARLLREGHFEDELERRAAAPPYRDRRVRIDLVQRGPVIEVTIRDDGAGFDFRAALSHALEPNTDPNGRGIILTRTTAFPGVLYLDPGNAVVVSARWP